jgi:hypothetical protein
MVNNSSPAGLGYFQGNSSVFGAHSGAADSYIGANFAGAQDFGIVSNWLILPQFTLNNGDFLSFYTRSVGSEFPDSLQVRFSQSGSTNVGDSTESVGDFGLLLSINSDFQQGEYPTQWTQYTVSLAGLQGSANGRFAFRYSGDANTNLDYIGIDTVSVNASEGVPEPSTTGLFLVAVLPLAVLATRRKRNAA